MVVPAGLGWVWFQFTRDGRGLKRDRLLEAAEQGDHQARAVIAKAAAELADLVDAVRGSLGVEDGI